MLWCTTSSARQTRPAPLLASFPLLEARDAFSTKANPVALLLPPLPRYHGENMTSPWRALSMVGMSHDAPPSAFTSPWCTKQSVARPIDLRVCVQRCSRPRHGHLRYEVVVAVPVCVTVVIGVRGARHGDSPEVAVVKGWWCGVKSRP
jgi:hypothetical protein